MRKVRGSGLGVRVPGCHPWGRAGRLAIGLVACAALGCDGSRPPAAGQRAGTEDAATLEVASRATVPPATAGGADRRPDGAPSRSEGGSALSHVSTERLGGREESPDPPTRPVWADLLEVPDSPSRMMPEYPRIEVDEARAAAAGIRGLSSRRLALYTDLPPGDEVDALPEVFDQAFPQWCEYFRVDPRDLGDWHLTGFLMEDKSRFVRAGLYRDGLPDFKDGFSWNYDFWLYEQPSDYYRRHLLLHEGTHGFMNTVLGACGPPWYMEGIAELMGTHRWHEGRLTMNHIPADRDEAPMWGRIRVIKDDFAAGRANSLEGVLGWRPAGHAGTDPYSWCWAAAAFLDRHPRAREHFRSLPRLVRQADFHERFLQLLGDDWDALREEWQIFVAGIEYGHDVGRTAVDFTPGQPLPATGARVQVAADRGWQNSRLRLEAGMTYHIRASGRYPLGDRPQVWWCEPGGVSIRYYQGRPLGILLGAVRPDEPWQGGPSPLIRPVVLGLEAALTPARSGTLFLRVNDSAAELDDNAGTLTVEVRAERG